VTRKTVCLTFDCNVTMSLVATEDVGALHYAAVSESYRMDCGIVSHDPSSVAPNPSTHVSQRCSAIQAADAAVGTRTVRSVQAGSGGVDLARLVVSVASGDAESVRLETIAASAADDRSSPAACLAAAESGTADQAAAGAEQAGWALAPVHQTPTWATARAQGS